MSDVRPSPAQPTVLLLATQRWPTGARLGLALQTAGFRVDLWAPTKHPLLSTGACAAHYLYGNLDPLDSLEAAVLLSQPDLIVPCDDLATFRLQQLTDRALVNPRLNHLLPVIECSLGPARNLQCLTARADMLEVATALGVSVPMSARIREPNELRGWFARYGFPAYIKADGTSGGIGVRPVHSYGEAQAAFRLLSSPPRALRALKRLAIDRDATLLGPLVRRQRSSISVQHAVAGADANSAIFCWHGRVLASIQVKVLATRYRRGPSTVVERIENPEMQRAAEKLASQLRLSGFFGLDFILDEQEAPWLLEMNSRATQIAHLALGEGHDLAAAAFSAVSGMDLRPRPAVTRAKTIALFPQEWQRDPASPALRTAFHDVPWEAPALVRTYVRQRPEWGQIFTHQFWQDLRKQPRGIEPPVASPEALP